MTYGVPLNRWGRQWIVEAGVGWMWQEAARNFSDYRGLDDGGEARIFGKRFDAKKIRIGVGYASSGFTPRIAIRHRISTLWWIHADAGFYQPVWSGQRVFAAEKSGFSLTRRKARGSLDKATLMYNGAPSTQSHFTPVRWHATIGLMLKY